MSTSRHPQYSETLEYLYNELPMFSKYGKGAIKTGLDNIQLLCERLDNPQTKFKAIHVAGTNGKGSVSHMLAAIFQRAGYKTGLYTSPHLVDFGERIKINGIPVEEDWVVHFTQQQKPLFAEVEPSFFEVTVAMAFQYFAEQECEIAIIETGLGGRLDSTNIINPLLSIITNIDYDHTDILGNTLKEIAGEKAGIIKAGVPFIVGERHKETEQVFFEHAIRKQCTLFYADAAWSIVKTNQDKDYQYLKAVRMADRSLYDIRLDLLGSYQLPNLKTVLCACDVLYQLGYPTDIAAISSSFSLIKKTTQLRGRWETLQQEPLVITDVGHNSAGMRYTLQQWEQVNASAKHILIGFVKDKDVRAALALLPKDNHYHFVNAQIPRALEAATLTEMAEEFDLKGKSYTLIKDAIAQLKSSLKKDEALLISGSFFVVGEAMIAWEQD